MDKKDKDKLDADLKEYISFAAKKKIPEHIEKKVKKEFFKKQYLNKKAYPSSYTEELEYNVKEFMLTLFLYENEITPEIEKLFLSLQSKISTLITKQTKLF